MDRAYKNADRVHVYQSDRNEKRLDVFTDKPYTHCGMDNYMYKGVMYKGFEYRGPQAKDDVVYILLDEPLFKPVEMTS